MLIDDLLEVCEEFISLVYPQKCLLCGKAMDYGEKQNICHKCRENYKHISGNTCEKCGRPIPVNNICRSCRSKKLYYDKSFAVYEYKEFIKKFIYNIKFFNRFYYCNYAAKEMYCFAQERNVPETDLIVPVPMHPMNYFMRGYNQAEILAKAYAKLIKGTYSDALVKVMLTKPQHKLSSAERLTNIKNAFLVKENIKGKTVMLIDDVFTTGSTVNECSKALKKAGAKAVYVFTFSIVNEDK